MRIMTSTVAGWSGGSALSAAFSAGVSAALFLTSAYMPFLGALAPAPLCLAFGLAGLKGGAALAVGSAVVVFAAAGAAQALLYLAFCGVMAGALAAARERRLSLERTFAAMVVPVYLAGAVLFVSMSSSEGKSFSELGAGWGDAMIGSIIESHKNVNTDKSVTDWLTENRASLSAMIGDVFPSLAALSLLMMAAANIVVTRILSLRIASGAGADCHSLSEWKTPDWMVWGVVFPGFGLLLTDGGALAALSANAMLIAFALFMIQGVAIIHHWFLRNNAGVALRALGYFVVFSHPLFMLLTSGLGLMEVWVDFRKKDDTSDFQGDTKP